MLVKMALFGKKKKTEETAAQPAENKQNNSVTDEMKIILEAREEEQKEREAKALERQQEQDEAVKAKGQIEDQAKLAAQKLCARAGQRKTSQKNRWRRWKRMFTLRSITRARDISIRWSIWTVSSTTFCTAPATQKCSNIC